MSTAVRGVLVGCASVLLFFSNRELMAKEVSSQPVHHLNGRGPGLYSQHKLVVRGSVC